MSTLADYQDRVRNLGYDASTDTQIDLAVNEARKRVVRDALWPFLEKDSTVSVDADDPEVETTTAWPDFMRTDAVRLMDGTTPRQLDWMPYQELRDRQTDDPATGEPTHWTHRSTAGFSSTGAIILWPTPDRAYSLTVDYVVFLEDLSGAAEDTIPERLSDLVVWAAVKQFAFRQRDAAAMQLAEGEYQALLRQAVVQTNIQQRQSSRQVRSGYWGTR